ncbi:MAG: orotate phosphoribosyltransferase [Bacteroidetes bacterium]|nr:orotate phosphoribosyltransferase [Bacteroidota bacterium]
MSNLSPATYDELVDLGRQLYDMALVRSEQEAITDPRGQPIGWLLDTRIPMLNGTIMPEIGRVLGERLRAKGVDQVVGFGFGSYALVASVVSSDSNPPFMGGFVREARKLHGRRRLVEGPLMREKPVVLLDDILNSGRSAWKAVELLRKDGFQVVGVMTLFNFTWSGGRPRLEQSGLWVDSLLDLNLRENER